MPWNDEELCCNDDVADEEGKTVRDGQMQISESHERLRRVQDAVGGHNTTMSPLDDNTVSEQTCQFRLPLNSDSGRRSNDLGSIDGATILFLEVLRLGYQSGGFQSNCIASSDEVTTASFFELALASPLRRVLS